MLTRLRALPGGLVAPLALAALATSGLAAVTSGALFTDSTSVAGSAFTAGTVKLSAAPATSAISVGNMAPGGDKVTPLNIANTGSLAERYSVLATADNADGKGLANALRTTVKAGVTNCTEAGFDADGTVIYGPGILGTPTGSKIVGDAAQGQQAGDRVLAAGASETLCVRVLLPSTAGNNLQAASTTATFTFDSEQVVNNP